MESHRRCAIRGLLDLRQQKGISNTRHSRDSVIRWLKRHAPDGCTVTKQNQRGHWVNVMNVSSNDFERLKDEYERTYLRGLIAEREAKAYLARGRNAQFAYDGFLTAMEHYEAAIAQRPDGNDDAILRYNACVRIIREEEPPRRRDDENRKRTPVCAARGR